MSASGLGRPASSLPRARYPVARNASASASSEPSSVVEVLAVVGLAPAPRTESSPRLISTQFMIQIIWRSWCNDDNATFQPPFSGPSRFSDRHLDVVEEDLAERLVGDRRHPDGFDPHPG